MKSKKPKIDEKRTAELDLPELQVIAGKGDAEHFFCIPIPSKAHPNCPRCGNLVARDQGKIKRNYYHVIPKGEKPSIVTISLEFRKNKCLTPGCGCVYYPSFSFASPYARVTRKLADVVVGLHTPLGIDIPLHFSKISEEFSGKISRQAVFRIYHHRLQELNTDLSEAPAWYRNLYENELRYSSMDSFYSFMPHLRETVQSQSQETE